MQSKCDPPISGLSSLFKGWTTDSQNKSLHKSFHFSSDTPLEEFCLSLLTSKHNKHTHLSATEVKETHDIQVEICGKVSKKETIDLVLLIESSYRETLSANTKKHHSGWPWWFKNLG